MGKRPLVMSYRLGIAAVFVCALASDFSAQEVGASRTFQSLGAGVSQVQAMRGILVVRAEWPPAPASASAAAGRPAARTLRLVNRRPRPGNLRRERRPELSADRLVVVVLDHNGAELDWRLVPNPSFVRAEWVGPDGQFVSGSAPTPTGDLLVTIPDLPGAAALRVYQPRVADDGGFVLDLAAELSLVSR